MGTRRDNERIPPRKCSAMSKQTGKPCGQYAVPGSNVCHYHGGAKKGVKNLVHGMYSKKVNISLAERYEEFLDHTDSVETLNSDIALMRAMMTDVLSTQTESIQDKEHQMYLFLRYMKDIRSAVSLKDDIESKFSISIQTVQIFLNQVLYILNDTITDKDELDRVVARLRNVKLLDEKHPQLSGSK